MAYKKILTIHLKREYWERIHDGRKKYEYRLATRYWRNRILRLDGSILKYDLVHLLLGYPKSDDRSKLLVRKCGEITRRTITHKEFGPDPVEVFKIDVSEEPTNTIPDRQAPAAAGDRQFHSGDPKESKMAKRKFTKKKISKKKSSRARDRQTTMGDICPDVPDEVQDAVDEYVTTLRKRMVIQTQENELRATATDLMLLHKLRSVDIDDGEKTCGLEPSGEKLKIKKKKPATTAA